MDDTFVCAIDPNDGYISPTCEVPNQTALEKDNICEPGADQALDIDDLAEGRAEGEFTGNPVRFYDGVVRYGETDFMSDGFGIPWGQTRAWTNGAGYATGQYNGLGWVDTYMPRVLIRGSDEALVLVTNGTVARFFTPVTGSPGSYNKTLNVNEFISRDTATGEVTFTDTTGNRFHFENPYGTAAFAQRGSFKKVVDPGGNVTQVTSRNADGKITEVQRSGTVGGVTVTESFLYSYIATGTNAGLMSAATLRRQTGTGPWATVRAAEYTYYDGVEANGPARALKLAVIKDGSGNTLDTSYYRYYVTGEAGGFNGALKYAFKPASYARLAAAVSNPFTATDAQVAPYADNYFEYDSSKRVTKEVAQGEGCSACTGGLGTFTFTYTSSTNAVDVNNWSMKTVMTNPDSSTLTVYTNAYAEPILSVFSDGTNTWRLHKRYDANGRPTLLAFPSAVSGHSETYADLMNYSGGISPFVNDSTGLIVTNTYYSSTTATATTAGSVVGYYATEKIKQGESGTEVPQAEWKYFTRTFGGIALGFLAEEKRFRNTDGTGAQTTSYAYTWQGTTYQPDTITVTLPTVTTAQNGPGTADAFAVKFDTFDRPTWAKDGDGFLHYAEYDLATSAVTEIVDVNSSLTTDFIGLPSGWSTPSGGGLHLKETAEVDELGRETKVTDPRGNITYSVYNDTNHEVRVYRAWDNSTNMPTGPTEVYREDRPGSYFEALTMSAVPFASGGRPTGQEPISGLQTLTRDYANAAGQTVSHDEYFDLTSVVYTATAPVGLENVNYYRTRLSYDERGRLNRTQTPTRTIYRTVFDKLGRPSSDWVGTNDTPASGFWSPTNNTAPANMVKVREFEYDDPNDAHANGGVGDGDLTRVTESPGGGADSRETRFYYDWRHRPVAAKGGHQGGTGESTLLNRPVIYVDYDNLDQVTKVRRYDGDTVSITSTSGVPNAPAASNLRAHTDFFYDEQMRPYLVETFSVNPSTGTEATNKLKTNLWYDRRGNTLKISAPGGLVMKYQYDGVGRTTKSFATDPSNGNPSTSETAWLDADDVTGDAVLEQLEFGYDANSNVIQTTLRRRFHDETDTGDLTGSGVNDRAGHTATYYDAANRPTNTVAVGTNGGAAWTRPSSAPARSDTVLVTDLGYNAAGRVETVTDPKGIVGKSFYDNLGRTTKTIENYVTGVPTSATDKTTIFSYDGSQHLTTLRAYVTPTAFQETQWVYGTSTSTGDVINSNDVLKAVRHPDAGTGLASSSEQDMYEVNGLGQFKTVTDRNGTVHGLSYDVLGRLTADVITTLGAGVDGAVRRLEYNYGGLGNLFQATSYSAASGGSVVNQVQREYNGLGQLLLDYQEHSGSVVTTTSPKVQYAYSEMTGGANHSRPTTMIYPNNKVLTFNYSGGVNSTISRLSSLSDSTGRLESYDYLGLNTVVRRAHSIPGVDLTYIKQGAEPVGDAGDQYTGLDRFDRVVDQRWIKTSSGTHTDRIQYGYDRNSNRVWRDNLVNTSFGEVYQYDDLNQLTSFKRGTLNAVKTDVTGLPSRSQLWNHDAQGNWNAVVTDGISQARTHNRQNEILTVGAALPTYDSNGNLTKDEAGRTFEYDAWNRLVRVKDAAGATIASYKYDALGQRVSETKSGTTTDLYYSAAWQLIEERVGGTAKAQYVWSPVYVDALILRDRDSDGNGSLEQRLWVQQDANWNVTALLDNSGNVVERYAYDPFGNFTVYDASYGVRAASSFAWVYYHQGLRYDSTVTSYINRRRVYDPDLGRFLQTDPIGFSAGDANLYRYVENAPVHFVDPTGLQIKIPPHDDYKGYPPEAHSCYAIAFDILISGHPDPKIREMGARVLGNKGLSDKEFYSFYEAMEKFCTSKHGAGWTPAVASFRVTGLEFYPMGGLAGPPRRAVCNIPILTEGIDGSLQLTNKPTSKPVPLCHFKITGYYVFYCKKGDQKSPRYGLATEGKVHTIAHAPYDKDFADELQRLKSECRRQESDDLIRRFVVGRCYDRPGASLMRQRQLEALLKAQNDLPTLAVWPGSESKDLIKIKLSDCYPELK